MLDVPILKIFITGVEVEKGVPERFKPKLTVSPTFATVVEALLELVVAVTIVRAAACA